MSDAQKPFGNQLVVVTGAGSGMSRLAPGTLRALARLEAARSPVRRGRGSR